MQFLGRKICRRRSELNSGHRRNSKIENSSNNSSTLGIYPSECRRFRIRRSQNSSAKTNFTRARKPLIWMDSRNKFNRATVLVLKHVDAQIKSDPIKKLEPPEARYKSEYWGPHSSLDVTKIKQELTETRSETTLDGGSKYFQNFNYFVGSLEQTMQRDANDVVIYGPASAAIHPARPAATAPSAQLQAYIEACQQAADELRDAQFPHGRPALIHRPLDSDLKTILLDALSTLRLSAYKNLYQQYCNQSHNGNTYTDLYNDIHDLVKYDSDGVKSSIRRARLKTATDLGALAQAAGAATLTAPAGKRRSRSNKQHPYAKRNSSHSTPRPIPISTTCHQILVVDRRRATELASLARTARAQVMGPSGAQHHPNAMRRTAARPSSHQQTRGKPTSYKSMDSRRSQRRHRSSPNSRTAREAR